MFDDVISTGLQSILTEIFESVDKNQLNVSLVGDIFKESHLELTDLRVKKTLFNDLNLPVEIKEGLVGKLVVQGLSGVMTGDPVTVTISEVLLLLAPGERLSDPEAGLAARRLVATLREMFANRYAEEFLEDALGIKMEDRMSVQAQNKLNRKLLRHIVRKVLAGVSVNLQTVHVRFELPAGGVDAGTPVKASAGVGGGGACDAVGVMLPTLALRTCGVDHPSFAKFAASTPLDRVAAKTRGAGGGTPSSQAKKVDGPKEEKKNFAIVRKRATLANLQVYCDYGVDSYVTAISTAVGAARRKASGPSIPGVGSTKTPSTAGAAAAARAVRTLFQQKWKSERHALLFKPLAVEVGAEVHQWDKPGGKSIAPTYRVKRVNVGVGELQAVLDSEQGRVIGATLREIVNLARRARFNRFVPQAFLPLRNLPPPKVCPPKPSKDGAPGGMLPSVVTWSWNDEREAANGDGGDGSKPKSAPEAVLRGGFKKEGGAWARAMWRFAGACVRHDVRAALTKKLPKALPSWNGALLPTTPSGGSKDGGSSADTTGNANGNGKIDPSSWRVTYLRLHARTLTPREAKNVTHKVPDVRRMGVPRGREPLSLEEMWEMARVESFAPGDEVIFLRTAAKISSHFEWGRARRARSAAKSSATPKGTSAEAVSGASRAAAAAANWTVNDDIAVLAQLDALRERRIAAELAEKEGGVGGAGGGEEDDDDDDDEIAQLQFASTTTTGFSDDEDESGSEDEDDSEDESDSEDEESGVGGRIGNGNTNTSIKAGNGGPKFSLADIAAKAKAGTTTQSSAATVVRTTGVGAGKKMGKAGEIWAKLLGLPRVVFQVESAGIELRTRISGGARRPLVALSAGGVSGTMEGDEIRRILWWELRVGQVAFRDLCSSWGKGGAKSGSPPPARTLLSGSASGVEGREWALGGDSTGSAARAFLVVRVVHDPNRFACGVFNGSVATLAELRTHVVIGCITGKIPSQVLAVFNAAARDILLSKKGTNSSRPLSNDAAGADDSARQLRVALGSVFKALSGPKSLVFRPKKRRGPSKAVRALSMARGAVAGSAGGSSSSGELDSKELYRVVAGMLPGDFEVRVHTSEIIVQVDSKAQDLLEAGKVALEAIGEDRAAADMKGGSAAADSIELEVSVAPFKVDACRSSHPNPELWVDTGIARVKLKAPEKAVEAVVTALLTSAQRTKAAVALLSSGGVAEDDA